MFVITESGRVLDFSPEKLLELVDGKWVEPKSPVSASEIWEGKELSAAEVSHRVKSGS